MAFGLYAAFFLLLTASYTRFSTATYVSVGNATDVFLPDKAVEVPNSILGFIENLARKILSDGISTLQVPSVEPFILRDRIFSFNASRFRVGNITIEELMVHGLTNFRFLDMGVQKSINGINCSGEKLSANTKMDLSNVEIDVNATGFLTSHVSRSLEGAAAVDLSKAVASLNVSACSQDSFMELDEFQFDIELNGIGVDFSNLNVSGIKITFLEKLVITFFDDFFNSQKAYFMDLATNYVKEEVKKREDDTIYKIIAEVIQLIFDAALN